MIFAPPRMGKSELVSRKFPAMILGIQPRTQIISASYGSELSFDFSRDVRNCVDGASYRALFPNVRLAADSQAKDRWHTDQGGGYVSAGVGTAITGRGADLLVIDDPVKDRAEAESQTIRDTVWHWYTSTAYSRLEKDAVIVLIMTRWHEDDLAGRLLNAELEGGDRWEKIELPALNLDGTSIWPEKFSSDVLAQTRKVIGEYDWAALYEQRPRPIEGAFFDEKDLLVNGAPVEFPRTCATVGAVIDSATKTGKEHDGTGVVYFAYENLATDRPLLILDWDYIQIEGDLLVEWLPSVYARLEELSKRCGARVGSIGTYIEDKASGMILLQQAQRRGWQATAIDSTLTSVGKSERCISISAYVRQHLVAMTREAFERTTTYKGVTRNHLLAQILNFRPGSKDMAQDDLLDCCTYGIALSLGNSEGF